MAFHLTCGWKTILKYRSITAVTRGSALSARSCGGNVVNVLALENSDEISNHFQSTCTDSDYDSSCWSNVYFRWGMTRTVRKELRKGKRKAPKPENWGEKRVSCTGPSLPWHKYHIKKKKKTMCKGQGFYYLHNFREGSQFLWLGIGNYLHCVLLKHINRRISW